MIIEYCLVKYELQNLSIRKIDEQMLMLKGFRKLAFRVIHAKKIALQLRESQKTFFFLENIWTEKIIWWQNYELERKSIKTGKNCFDIIIFHMYVDTLGNNCKYESHTYEGWNCMTSVEYRVELIIAGWLHFIHMMM